VEWDVFEAIDIVEAESFFVDHGPASLETVEKELMDTKSLAPEEVMELTVAYSRLFDSDQSEFERSRVSGKYGLRSQISEPVYSHPPVDLDGVAQRLRNEFALRASASLSSEDELAAVLQVSPSEIEAMKLHALAKYYPFGLYEDLNSWIQSDITTC
jgi:hypothetical protein